MPARPAPRDSYKGQPTGSPAWCALCGQEVTWCDLGEGETTSVDYQPWQFVVHEQSGRGRFRARVFTGHRVHHCITEASR